MSESSPEQQRAADFIKALTRLAKMHQLSMQEIMTTCMSCSISAATLTGISREEFMACVDHVSSELWIQCQAKKHEPLQPLKNLQVVH